LLLRKSVANVIWPLSMKPLQVSHMSARGARACQWHLKTTVRERGWGLSVRGWMAAVQRLSHEAAAGGEGGEGRGG